MDPEKPRREALRRPSEMSAYLEAEWKLSFSYRTFRNLELDARRPSYYPDHLDAWALLHFGPKEGEGVPHVAQARYDAAPRCLLIGTDACANDVLQRQLEAAGAHIVLRCDTARSALAGAASAIVDFAVVELDGNFDAAIAVVDWLGERSIPILFITEVPQLPSSIQYLSTVVLRKPIFLFQFFSALEQLPDELVARLDCETYVATAGYDWIAEYVEPHPAMHYCYWDRKEICGCPPDDPQCVRDGNFGPGCTPKLAQAILKRCGIDPE
jgi:hypothetical protein